LKANNVKLSGTYLIVPTPPFLTVVRNADQAVSAVDRVVNAADRVVTAHGEAVNVADRAVIVHDRAANVHGQVVNAHDYRSAADVSHRAAAYCCP
jgi:hypothetical protein